MWLTKQAKLTKKRRIEIGGSYASFLKSLGLGADYKTRKRFKEQIERFLNARMSIKGLPGETHPIADNSEIWWNRRRPNDDTLFTTFIDLGEAFFEHCQSAMPVIAADVHRLQHSPFQIDIYTWLNHRLFNLQRKQSIPYFALSQQFGCHYKNQWHFRHAFRRNLSAVRNVYIQASVETGKNTVTLFRSGTTLPRRGGNMGLNYPQTPVDSESYPRVNGDAGRGTTMMPIWDKGDATPPEWTALCQKLKALSK